MKCKHCGKLIVCACCGETEYSQHVTDGHKFEPKPCVCRQQENTHYEDNVVTGPATAWQERPVI